MKRRKWESKTKAMVVLQGLKGRLVADICNEHQISQSEYYRWREEFLAKMPQLFENHDKKEALLLQENTRLKKLVGELTLELKKKRVARMKRVASASVQSRNQPVLERVRQIKADHPFWGYRRVWSHLKYVDELDINKKRILRLMKEHGLLVNADTRLKAKRIPNTSKPQPEKPNQWWGIDMTKVMVHDFGWMYIVAVLDWYTKKIVGYYAGLECKAKHWLEALDMASNTQFPDGVKGKGIQLMSDNGSQPTSETFMRACRDLGIKQAFTSYNNPKGNADTERLFRTMKEELFWLREWNSPFDLVESLSSWVDSYNRSYLHSTLRYKSPNKFEEEYLNSHCSLLIPA
jgi:transposase InsO family protein